MRLLLLSGLAAMLMIGCSSDKVTGPDGSDPLDYGVIGDDSPATLEMAYAELSEVPVTVPDPVEATDPALHNDPDFDAGMVGSDHATIDRDGRMHMRRILGHLRERMHQLRECMATNDDPQLRRLAHGAHEAIQHGIRALQNDHPRMALHSFHVANRVLNMAIQRCEEGGE